MRSHIQHRHDNERKKRNGHQGKRDVAKFEENTLRTARARRRARERPLAEHLQGMLVERDSAADNRKYDRIINDVGVALPKRHAKKDYLREHENPLPPAQGARLDAEVIRIEKCQNRGSERNDKSDQEPAFPD